MVDCNGSEVYISVKGLVIETPLALGRLCIDRHEGQRRQVSQ